MNVGFVAQNDLMPDIPLPQLDLAYGNGARNTKSRKTIEDCCPKLDLGDLSIEVPRGQALTEYFHTFHSLPGKDMRSMIPRGGFDAGTVDQ